MDDGILSILKTFGWTEGFRMPVANRENKTLESNVENLLKTGIQLSSKLKNHQDNWNNIKYFFNTIVEERHQNEDACLIYARQRDTENDLLTRDKNQLEILKAKRNDVLKKNKTISDENENLRVRYNRIRENVENLRKNIDWSEELEQLWLDYTNDGNEDINLMEKYNTQNVVKFEKLDLQRRKLVSEKEEYDVILDRKYREICSSQCALHSLAKLSRKTQDERMWLLEQWESAVKVLQVRDKEIQDILRETTIFSQVIRNFDSKISEQKNFYEEQMRNNTETTIETRRKETKLNKAQITKENLTQNVDTLNYTVTDLQRKLSSLGVEISQKRKSNIKLKKFTNKQKTITEDLLSANENLKKKRRITENRSTSVNERIKQLNKILQEEQLKWNLLFRNYENLEKRWQQIKFTSEEANDRLILCDSELRQLARIRISLSATIKDKKYEIERQIDVLVETKNQENQILARIGYLKGEKTNEEAANHKKILDELSTSWEQNNNVLEKTNSELVAFENQITQLKKVITNFSQKKDELASKKENVLTNIDGDEKRLAKITEENLQKTITENITRLRVNQLENTLSKGMDKVYSLRKRNIELNTVLQKHDLEIHTASELLKMRKKSLNREISSIKKNIEQIHKRIEQHMKRYEIIVDGLGKNEDGQPPTLSDYKIRIVKERCALLEKGDILDERVRTMEKEIRAMENTLTLVNVSNDTYKQHLYSIDHDSQESKKYEELKNERTRISAMIKNRQNIAADLKLEINNLTTSLANSKLQNQLLDQTKLTKEQDFQQLQILVEQQHFKFNRVQNKLKRLRKSLKTEENFNFHQREFLAKELQNINKNVLQRITQLVGNHNDIDDIMRERLSAKGISLPDIIITTKLKDSSPSTKTGISNSNDSSLLKENTTNIVQFNSGIFGEHINDERIKHSA